MAKEIGAWTSNKERSLRADQNYPLAEQPKQLLES